MKAALKDQFTLTPINLPDATKQELLHDNAPFYAWVKLPEPHRQDGNDFSYVVAPFKFTDEMKGIQNGAGVLCQTEAEAKETYENLRARGKKHLVAVQAAGFGIVGWVTSCRRTCNEIGVSYKLLPGGGKMWLAFDREVDLDTLETKIIRRKEADSEEARYWHKQWQDEYNQKKKAHFDSIGKSVTPPPPPRCTALTKQEIEDLGKAKMTALQKQWPRCFAIFEKQKLNPSCKVPDQQIEDAYLLDLVANGGDQFLKSVEGGKVRADIQLISSLNKAAQNYARRGKSKIIDTAIYLIAFNWELGWCYLSDEQLAEKLGEILETKFTPGQVKQYRYRTLELVAKHPPGPSPNTP